MLKEIAKQLELLNVDAWIIYDFASKNPVFKCIFGNNFSTRRLFAIIDKHGANTLLCHVVDYENIKKIDIIKFFNVKIYKTWQELNSMLKDLLSPFKTIMMEISDNGLMPKASYVDYGTVCFIKKFVKNIISSGNLFQKITATFSGKSLELYKKAALLVDKIKDEAFNLISKKIKEYGEVTEFEIQQYILKRFKENNLVTDGPPIVAIEKNASDPHYQPTKENCSLIKKGNMVLIDLWAKYDDPLAVFADITWIGYVGKTVPAIYKKAFEAIKESIELALNFLECELQKRKVYGYEIDDICSNHLKMCGYGEYIKHRTGHSLSIGDSDHGMGVNIDNFETHDTREIINHIAFSLEPGIYTTNFGIRKEINVYINNNKPEIYTKQQDKILLL